MVKKKQKPVDKNIKSPVTSSGATSPNATVEEGSTESISSLEASEKQQQEQGAILLRGILDPITQTLAAQTKAINALNSAVQELQIKPQAPLLPPELTKMLPSILEGIMKIFTAPETPPEAARMGLFDEELMLGYKKHFLEGLTQDEMMKSETLRQLKLQNDIRAKQLESEF